MRFEIGLTNGNLYFLNIGNGNRCNEYRTLKELFKDLEQIIKISVREYK